LNKKYCVAIDPGSKLAEKIRLAEIENLISHRRRAGGWTSYFIVLTFLFRPSP
jgi:hypothetical protein